METSKKISTKQSSLLNKIYKQRLLFLMSVPFIIYLIIFSYVPVWGWLIAFIDYKPGISIFESKFVGFKFFKELLTSPDFYLAFRNTLVMSSLGLVMGTLTAVIFAILINEISHVAFKRIVQTISYLPHFVSWVVMAGILTSLLSTDNGLFNYILIHLNLTKQAIPFMMKGSWFWGLVTSAGVWKETGWNAIIYLAAIVGINPELYEAAVVDGANRFGRIWHITLPGIKSTIVIMTVLNIGWLLGWGFDQSMLLGNGMVMSYSDVISTYVYRFGIGMGRFSFATAAGIFQSIISIFLLIIANLTAKKLTGTRVM